MGKLKTAIRFIRYVRWETPLGTLMAEISLTIMISLLLLLWNEKIANDFWMFSVGWIMSGHRPLRRWYRMRRYRLWYKKQEQTKMSGVYREGREDDK